MNATTALHDMHCHLDFTPDAANVAKDAQTAGSMIFANTVTPEGYLAARSQLGDFENIKVGFGMHPWWVSGGEDIVRALEEADPTFIGEVGLDMSRRYIASAKEQTKVFGEIASWAAQKGGRLLSIHSVKAASEVLDILEATGIVESCTCIFHWFSGPSDQLKRAKADGCYFSFGTRSLATGKGREYAKAIPESKLLLETDYPPERDAPCAYAEIQSQLHQAAQAIAVIKGESALETIAETSANLLRR